MSQFLEYLKMAVANIRANKMRSLLTMLGIIIGISSVILIMSVGNGAKNIITDEMADIGINQIAIYSYDDTNSYDITQEDIDALYDGVKGNFGRIWCRRKRDDAKRRVQSKYQWKNAGLPVFF